MTLESKSHRRGAFARFLDGVEWLGNLLSVTLLPSFVELYCWPLVWLAATRCRWSTRPGVMVGLGWGDPCGRSLNAEGCGALARGSSKLHLVRTARDGSCGLAGVGVAERAGLLVRPFVRCWGAQRACLPQWSFCRRCLQYGV